MDATTAIRLLQSLCFLWAGLVVGISFLEAPVKFTAPKVTRKIGLDVGRHVFAALNRAELGLALIGLVAFSVAQPEGAVRWGLGGVAVVLLTQTLWLLPALRRQARGIIDGERDHASSFLHVGYGLLDGGKVLALCSTGWLIA
jgi:hypothetical protein